MTATERDRPDEVEGEAFSAGRAGSPDETGVTELSALGPPPWRPICMTCGVQFAPRDEALDVCPICADERQYIGWHGQQWTTLDRLRQDPRGSEIHIEEPGLGSLNIVPATAIGQRAYLIETPEGTIIWDCTTYFDDKTLDLIRARGPVLAMAISHPHFYASMSSWAEALNIPVYIHAADREWVMDPSDHLVYWQGETLDLTPGVTLVQLGGHFTGSSALHWANTEDGLGALVAGDTIKTVMDRRYVGFMYSVVNFIPMGPTAVKDIVRRLEPFEFDRIYSLWSGHMVPSDGKAAITRSAARHLEFIQQ